MASKKSDNLVNLANEAAEKGDWNTAIENLEKAVVINPDDKGILSGLGACYLQVGKAEDSIQYFSKVIELENKLPDPFCNLGMAYYAVEKFAEAEEAYKKALAIDPSHVMTRKNLAVLYVRQTEHIGEGLKLLVELLKENPKDLEIVLMVSSYYLLMGMNEAVEKFCLYALSLDPENEMAKNMLAQARLAAETQEKTEESKTGDEKTAQEPAPTTDVSKIARPEHAQKLSGLKKLIQDEKAKTVTENKPLEPIKQQPVTPSIVRPSIVNQKPVKKPKVVSNTSKEIDQLSPVDKASYYTPLASNMPVNIPVTTANAVPLQNAGPSPVGNVCMYGGGEFSVGLRLFTLKRILESYGMRVKLSAKVDPADIQNFDTFVFERPQLDQNWANALSAALQARKKVIIDIEEDFHNLPPDHPGFSIVGQGDPNRLNVFEQMLKAVDLVTVSSAVLADRYKTFARQVIYLPTLWNASVEWWNNPAPKHKSFNVGWFDTAVEIPNLSLVKDDLLKFLNETRNAILVVAGDVNAYHYFEGSISDEKILFLPFINFDDYPFLLAHFDVEISPYRKTAYNLSKSDFRLVEAGARRIPWIASPIPAYEDWREGGIFAEKSGDWYKALKSLYYDTDLRTRLGETGREKAKTREVSAQPIKDLVASIFNRQQVMIFRK